MSEDLDIMNVIECNRIIQKLGDDEGLILFFKIMIRLCNSKLNDKALDKVVSTMDLENYIEPILSSDSEDDIM